MGREDPFLVRQTAAIVGEATSQQAILNRMGFQVVTDFFTQLILGGYTYHMQLGTEDAPINSTTSIDDQLVWAVVDNNSGYALIPVGAQVLVANWTTATLVNSMLEADKDKVRYSSGGTAYVPANLRGDDPRAFSGAAYVGTDVTVAAKSAVPNTVELYRGQVIEDAQATPAAGDATVAFLYSARINPFIVLTDVSSLLLHHGSATADVLSYGSMQFAQFEKGLVV